jgi:ABC-type transport system involved in cytochrome c biogenesis permease subunit
MFVGAILSKGRMGRFFTGDPREIGALVMWALYALFLNVRLTAGWRGKKGIVLSLVGFVGVILTFLGLGHRM